MDGGFGADVDAAGGFIDDEQPAAAGEPLGDDDFLLVSAGHGGDGGGEGGGFDAESGEVVRGLFAFGAVVEEAESGELAEEGKGKVLAAAHHEDESLAFAVFGDEADAAAHGFADVAEREGFVVESDLAGGVFVEAEEGFGDLAAASADETGEADDFARADLERDIAEFAGAGKVFDVEHDRAVGVGGGVLRQIIRDGAADHHLDDLIFGAFGPEVWPPYRFRGPGSLPSEELGE